MDLAARTDQLFVRSSAGDVEGVLALCASGCSFRQNGGPDGGADALRTLIGGIAAAGITTAYSNVRRIVADRAVVEQHLVTLTRADGAAASSDVCAVLRFDEDGMVTELDEYLDMTAFAPVFT